MKPLPERPAIAVILTSSLGDVARGLAIVSPLKEHFPGSRLTWVVEPKCAGLVQLHPRIDRVVVFPRNIGAAGLRAFAGELRSERYDLVLDLQRIFKSGFFSLLTGARRRVGFHRHNSKEGNWLFQTAWIDAFSERQSKLQHYMKFLEYLEVPQPAQFDFGLGHVPLADPSRGTNLIGIVMGSSWESKDWTAEGYLRLTRYMAERGREVLLLGDKSQAPLAEKLREAVGSTKVQDLAGKTSLPQLIGYLKQCALCIGPDSGPGHLAAAVNTPYVSLFGPTAPERVAPHGSEHLVVRANVDCMPCYYRRCRGLNKLCMRLISVDSVLEKARLVLPDL